MLKNYKKKIKAPWVVEVIVERFDNALELMMANSIVYGGAVRDSLAGMPLEGDLDICATPADADTMHKMFISNTRWHPEKDLPRPKKRVRGLGSNQPETSVKLTNTKIIDVNMLPSGDMAVNMDDGSIYEIKKDDVNFSSTGEIEMDTGSLVEVKSPDIEAPEEVEAEEVEASADPYAVESEGPYKLNTHYDRTNKAGFGGKEYKYSGKGKAYKYGGGTVTGRVSSSKKQYSKNLRGRVRSYNNADGQKLQIVVAPNKRQHPRERSVSKLATRQLIERVLTTVRACDIVCCAVYMDTDGNVFEALPNAYEDCRSKVLNLNKSVITATLDIGALTERVKKLEARGWKSNINLKALKDKVAHLLEKEEKRSKAKAKHLKEKQEKNGKPVEGDVLINWGNPAGEVMFLSSDGSYKEPIHKKKKNHLSYAPPPPKMEMKAKVKRHGNGMLQRVVRKYSKAELAQRWLSLTDADQDIRKLATRSLNIEAKVNCTALPNGGLQVELVHVSRGTPDNRVRNVLNPSAEYREIHAGRQRMAGRMEEHTQVTEEVTKKSFSDSNRAWLKKYKSAGSVNDVILEYPTDDHPVEWDGPRKSSVIKPGVHMPKSVTKNPYPPVIEEFEAVSDDAPEQSEDVMRNYAKQLKQVSDYAKKMHDMQEMTTEASPTPVKANRTVNVIISKTSIIREYGNKRDFLRIASNLCAEKFGGDPFVSVLGYTSGYNGDPDGVLVTVRKLPNGVNYQGIANFLRIALK